MAGPIHKFKIIFLGDVSVGKTSLINQFMFGTFDHAHQPTIGVDFLSKTISLDDRTVKLQLWDTAGQERFRSLIPAYIRDSSAAVIVYDVTQRQSYLNLVKWVSDVRTERGPEVLIMLVGNKTDLVDTRSVTLEDAEAFARANSCLHLECSAKGGINVQQVFRKLALELGTEGQSGKVSGRGGDVVGASQFRLEVPKEPEEVKSKCSC
jgi:Ras-related protein Rab-6A